MSSSELDVFYQLSELLSQPTESPKTLKGLGLLTIQRTISGPHGAKITLTVDIEKLLALCATNDIQASAASRELAYAIAMGDRVSIMFTLFRLMSTIGVGARGRNDILRLISGTKERVQVSTNLTRFRRLITGGRKEVEIEEIGEDEEDQDER